MKNNWPELCDYAKNALSYEKLANPNVVSLSLDELFFEPVIIDLNHTKNTFVHLMEWVENGGKKDCEKLTSAETCLSMIIMADYVGVKQNYMKILTLIFSQCHLPGALFAFLKSHEQGRGPLAENVSS